MKVKIKSLKEMRRFSEPVVVETNGERRVHLQHNKFGTHLDYKGTFNMRIMYVLCDEIIEVDEHRYEGAYSYRLDLDNGTYMDLLIGKWMTVLPKKKKETR